MSKSMTMTNSFPSHAHMTIIRQEAQLRRLALFNFGPQGVLDLALLGAILGNNIREIGRYRVTCNGQLVQGQYTIYELVHFGVLSVTGRRSHRNRQRGIRSQKQLGRSSMESLYSDFANSNNTTTTITTLSTPTINATVNKSTSGQRVYPTTLANMFPHLVFKAMRKKSIRPPKFQHDDSAPSSPFQSIFTCEDISEEPSSPSPSDIIPPTTNATTMDSMLISSEKVLSDLIQKRLHRVKDLPLPRELCFLGAVSLPLPTVLRAMHVAWTMDFLNMRATTARRQQQQQKKMINKHQTATTEATTITSSTSTKVHTGGLEFRPDIYAHKMRLARVARAQQQQKQTAVAATIATSARSVNHGGGDPSTLMTVMPSKRHTGPSSTSIPEENEDEDQAEAENENDRQKKQVHEMVQTPSSTMPCPSTTTTTTTTSRKSVRQDKRLMQQLLSLESKVPRIVRQWSKAARSCFAEELTQEDRQVQDWVDRQRIQVVLGSGYRFVNNNNVSTTPTSTTTTMTSTITPCPSSSSSATSRPRPILKPIATTLANAAYQRHQNHRVFGPSPLLIGTPRAPPMGAAGTVGASSSSFSSSPTTGKRLSHSLPLSASFGTRMITGQGVPIPTKTTTSATVVANGALGTASTPITTADMVITRSRPTSVVDGMTSTSGGGLQDRLSASQQMLSMHLWLSLLVSPISPEHMVPDQFSFMDSQT
ncbi:hypothetical protein BGX28_010016 [Mortierella sp. GBA30]|nr:hypothetical protein BGX28_010016 [Mortierella sp. GBA30]